MISVEEALKIVIENRLPVRAEEVSLIQSIDRILAEDIIADRDLPPYERVAMDGIAVNLDFLDSINVGESFDIEDTQFAGQPQKILRNNTNCMEVMTGAVMPINCDTVIRYEDLEISEENGKRVAQVNVVPKAVWLNVHRKGSDRKLGEILVSAGTKVCPAEIAVMAAVGKATVMVMKPAKVAVISTGDELVEVDQKPASHQIRLSNSYLLGAALKRIGIDANLFHLTDDIEILSQKIEQTLADHDVLILSGGVSEGKADFVPKVLQGLGVNKLFHKVSQKPGKPFWFGKTDTQKVVFALPGNPVSTAVCYYKYVQPFLSRVNYQLSNKVVLGEDITFDAPLTYFVPVVVTFNREGVLIAKPVKNNGSGDFAMLTQSEGFIELPPHENEFVVGEIYKYINFRG